MRAVVCTAIGAADTLEVLDVPEPAVGKDDVLIDVKNAGINFPDLLIVQGMYQTSVDPPFVPGAEGAGVVIGVGDDVRGLARGDEVIFTTLSGAFAERAAVPAASVTPKPVTMPFEQAAAFAFTFGTSLYALRERGDLQQGETTLVLGAAGGVGSAAVQIAKALGSRVIAAASTAEKVAFATSIGADETINYTNEDLRTRIKDLTDGAGVDVVYDPVGGPYTEPALRSTGWGGRYLVIGFAAGEIPRIPLNLPLLKGFSVVGVFWGSWLRHDPAGARRNMDELAEMFESGLITPQVMEVFGLDCQRDAFRLVMDRHVRGKVVLDLGL